ncbi:3-isopropylmalate dehydratase small subunit [uncultured Parasphingorhabdus sp.]|uniref:3-isopropylmalate dehydratase small subunit n=1 Tax=uncultured Parasphingorhabdus sp. TaxID=2709694 RepID=UPI002AA74A81|nr:3-isopropylmalate dehydratase small subunit [uncultured Parasphingorhabdus sp.]
MRPISTITGRAIPLELNNIDTDVIISSEWLKTISREGLGEGAFASLREDPQSSLNQPEFSGAPILISGTNFGCGSSREHAVWALVDMGIRAVIAPSFADIFSSNAFKNGLIAGTIELAHLPRLLDAARGGVLCVDLINQCIVGQALDSIEFEIDPFHKKCLVRGVDEIELTLQSNAVIDDFERRERRSRINEIARPNFT